MPKDSFWSDLATQVQREFNVAVEWSADLSAPGFADWQRISQLVQALIENKGQSSDWKVIGISGSQGSGKSSLARQLVMRLNADSPGQTHADCVSLDDFYLSQAQRGILAEQIHPLLATRGVPGTHDVAGLQAVIQQAQDGKRPLTLPTFDKALDNPVGTRSSSADLLILEGWCLGVQPQAGAQLQDPVNELERTEDAQLTWRRWVNQQIAAYLPVWEQIDFWMHLRVPSFMQVFEWRKQQEQQLPRPQQMTDAQLARFVAHYERLTRWIWACEEAGPGLVLELDESHQLISAHVKMGNGSDLSR